MKYTVAAALAFAAGSMAAPAAASKREPEYEGFIVPTVLSVHDVNSNLNNLGETTKTVRQPGIETTTLYEIPVPPEAVGKTCKLVVFSGDEYDIVEDEQALDIFNNNIDDLSALEQGNFRNNLLARVRFDEYSGFFEIDAGDVTPVIDEFTCPDVILQWESVSVGEKNKVVLKQDFAEYGENVLDYLPNGLSIAFY
ncbi:hypothetical protein MKZ38_007410 [Zalerion maritima]|uniref:Ubiquitin 3 binding protein But2 C-terminal domain-containing protein n=1 Tax=Zalerion maritima TaxID=339359 RepID=A0AAD5RUT2_9PEZI|nr:hypothetical protein MKZ38_007410 [Zalerion maritima]